MNEWNYEIEYIRFKKKMYKRINKVEKKNQTIMLFVLFNIYCTS